MLFAGVTGVVPQGLDGMDPEEKTSIDFHEYVHVALVCCLACLAHGMAKSIHARLGSRACTYIALAVRTRCIACCAHVS